MDQERVEQIRQMGDHLADYIHTHNDRRFLAHFRVRNYHTFRTLLLRVNTTVVKEGQAPIITYDPYIAVFEQAEDDYRPDWQLARDLLMIRIIERLYQLGKSDVVAEVASELTDDEEAVAQSTQLTD